MDRSLITTGHEASAVVLERPANNAGVRGRMGTDRRGPRIKRVVCERKGRGTGIADRDGEEIVGMGMAMEERRYVWGCIYLAIANDDVCCRGWSRAVAAVPSIHHSLRLFVVARAPNEIFNLKSCYWLITGFRSGERWEIASLRSSDLGSLGDRDSSSNRDTRSNWRIKDLGCLIGFRVYDLNRIDIDKIIYQKFKKISECVRAQIIHFICDIIMQWNTLMLSMQLSE